METQPLAPDNSHPQKRRQYAADDNLVKPRDLPKVVSLSTVSCWRLRKQGAFPAPIRLSPGRVAWRRSDLERWLEERQQASR